MFWDEDVLDLRRQKRGLLQQRDLHGNLGFHIRSDQALRPAIVPCICGFDNTENPIAISQGRTLCLQNETNGGLSGNISWDNK
jgi:hypothetical protein